MMRQELRMKIPYEFEQFVGCIYPVDPRESESLESRAAAAIEDWAGNDLRPVLAFLNELLDGGHSDAELHYVWRRQSPIYDFSPGGHRVFFEELRRQIIELQR
jgi:hypothetical protein